MAINLKSGVIWTFSAFVVMGLVGVGLNLLIGRYYDASALGIFNQVFALYIIVSQFASFGFWLSALRYVSELSEDKERASQAIVSAIMLVTVSSSAITLLCYLTVPLVERVFDSHGVAVGWRYALPGLWAYSINKVLLAVINANRDMHVYSLAQITRYLIIISVLLYASLNGVEPDMLPLALTIPELVLMPLLLGYISKRYITRWNDCTLSWLGKHYAFGLRSFLSGTMAELNTRVDVIMLGIFMNDLAVGIYSMAAIIAEGISQLSIVLRDNLNPIITQYFFSDRHDELQSYLRRSIKLFYLLMAAVYLISIFLFSHALEFLTGGVEFAGSWYVFLILSAGFSLASGYLPLNMLLAQGGYPAIHMRLKIYVVAVNMAANLLLIPIFGVYGAALGTAFSFVSSVILLKYFAKTKMKLLI